MSIQAKNTRKVLKIATSVFILMNIVAFFHAYKFTHFTDRNVEKTKDAKKLTLDEKLEALFMGIDNPRPLSKLLPSRDFETVSIQSNKRLEAWLIHGDSAKGTVIFFHGFSGEKSSMLDKAEVLLRMGYDALLVDFMGSGGSEGNETTIGYLEAEEVKSCFDFMKNKGEKNIYLFGTSMGAAAILKSEHDDALNPKGIILESPFGSMYATTCARFDRMNVPSFPMAGLLDFWGGIQNGFWAFGHNPTEYAKKIDCPVLLMYGRQDETVSEAEIKELFANIRSEVKELKIYPNAAHENFLKKYRVEWTADVADFMWKTQ